MKHIRQFIFAALTLLMTAPACAYDFEVDGIYYQITNTITPYEVGVTNNGHANSYSGHVVIPNQVYHNGIGYYVTSICGGITGNQAFGECTELLSVEMPNSIREIGMGAFNQCTGLTTLTISQSVEYIDRGAFRGCSALTTVNYNAINCVMSTTGPYVFEGCSSVSTLDIGEGVVVLPDYAFRGIAGLSSVTIPNSVTSIGKGAFSGCITSPASIIIPNSVASIGEYAFSGCTGITSISLSDSLTIVGNSTFNNCTGLTSITIPGSVIDIGVRAFNNCMSLTTVILPNTLTIIRRETFLDCTSLKSITIPSSVIFIEERAFCGCVDLPNIDLPNSITNIGTSAFAGCSGLTSIEFPDSVTSVTNIECDAFYGCSSLTSITIPVSVQYICPNAFRGCSSLISIIVDDDNPVFDSRNNCNAIIETEVNTLMCGCKNTIIPNSVTDIGADAFYGCTGLTSITIPHTVTTIWGNPFAYCPNLVSLAVESGNPKYDSRNYCNAIIETTSNILSCGYKNSNIPDSVIGIGSHAFMGCSSLTSIMIPNSITSISRQAFYGCTNLSSITIPNSVTIIGTGAFENTAFFDNDNNWERGVLYINDCCIKAKQDVIEVEYNINNGTRLIADDAFSSCSGLVSVSIPNSVISIGGFVFSNCRSLSSITIPNSVISIGDFVFSNCRSLLSITIPNSVISIGHSAFDLCTNLTKVCVKSITPPTCGVKPFDDYDIPIYVPCGSKEAYSYAEVWKDYTNITETELQYDIEIRSSDDAIGNAHVTQQPDCENHLVTVLAEPINGSAFLYWAVDGQVVSIANPYTFLVENDVELVAVFSGSGIDEETTEKITISPNPTRSMVNIECENMKGVTVYTLDGRIVKAYGELNANAFTLDMSSLSRGIYILRIKTQGGAVVNRKIIKE